MNSTVVQTSPTIPPTILPRSRNETAKRLYFCFPIFSVLYPTSPPSTAFLVVPTVRSTEIAGISSAHRHVHRRLRELRVEAALIEFGNQRPFQFVAFIEEGDAERKTDVGENLGIFSPGDHRTRAHHRRQIAIGESVAGQ